MKQRTEYDNINVIGNTWEDSNSDSTLIFNKYDKDSRERIADAFFHGEKATRVLDLGCSIGAWLDFFTEHGSKEIVGIDISKERLAVAKKRGYTKTVVANGTSLPFQDNHFDAVFCIDVLVHTLKKESWAQIFREVHRTLKPGGVFILSIANRKGERLNDAISLPVRLLKRIFGSKARDTSQYCVLRTKKEVEVMLCEANLIIERTQGQRFSYPDILIYCPRTLHLLDRIFGRTFFKDYARVIFLKVRKAER
jgi:ubiquinone/menaquinone biosynthesis C-methylase UbiE